MKKNQIALLKDVSNDNVNQLFTFVIDQQFDEFVSLQKMRETILNSYLPFIDLHDTIAAINYIASIEDFNFYDRNNYSISNDLMFYGFVNNLSSFRDELIIQIRLKFKTIPNLNDYKLERQISPPLDAYVFTGHNKLNITSSGREFAFLFE